MPRHVVAEYNQAEVSQILVHARDKCRRPDDRVWVCCRREGVRDVSSVQKRRWGRISHVRFATDAGGAESLVLSWRWQSSANSTSWSAGSQHIAEVLH